MDSQVKAAESTDPKAGTELKTLYPRISPDGAEKEPIDSDKNVQLVHRGKPAAAHGGSPQVTDLDSEKPVSDAKGQRCEGCRRCCLSCCQPCMVRYNPLSADPSRGERVRHAFLCPPHGKLARVLTLALTVLVIWGVLWAITGSQALPGKDGNFFGILILLIFSVIGGEIVALIRLPPLLGTYSILDI